MDHRAETRTFLTSRRARITPEQAGLVADGNRRVTGLRRGEVAVLAGVSVEYYTRMERGNLTGVSESVLDAVACALQLDETERTHLLSLAWPPFPTVDVMTSTSLKLNNGVVMPALGFGVFQSPPEVTAAAVETALKTGYRHIDTAAAYGNEREVGEGIRRSGLDRSEVFIETKVWVSDYGYDRTLHAFDKAAGKLGVEQIDLLILHQPAPKAFEATIAAYRALEKLLADGKVRSIGVSNFMPRHLAELIEHIEVVPAVNQVELHPYFTQPEVQQADAKYGILTQAWSPIGGITFYPGWGEHRKSTLSDPVLGEIADTLGKTSAQVMLRWHLQQGRSAIPKSTKPARIAENFDVFDFELSAEEITRIDALDTGVRHGPDPDERDPISMGITIPEA